MRATYDTRDELEAELTTRDALIQALDQLEHDINAVVAEAGEERAVRPGSFGDLSLKDQIAHLNGWRLLTAARLEAGFSGDEPDYPWPDGLTEDEDLDAINAWFTASTRDASLQDVMDVSAETFERCRRAIAALPDEALFEAGRFPWAGEYRLGPAVVSGTWFHFYEDHEPEIRAWLAAG
ncbi:MAG: hypothetical protein DCC58_03940 [Chloroflexi bacterium]|nr:MAG: hypothetical protein DCC58_03940 [Chloroflexota bacterium]